MFRRWWVWILVPIVVLLIPHSVWTLMLAARFEQRIDEIRDAGEPLELTDLAPPPVPENDNGAPLFLAANAWYLEHLKDEPEAVYAHEQLDDESRAELHAWLAKGAPYRAMLRRALAKPAFRPDLKWSAGYLMEVWTIPALQSAARFLELEVRYAERASPESLEQLELLFQLAKRSERSIAITLLMRWTIDGVAADTIEDLAAKPGFDAAAARARLDARLRATQDPRAVRDAFWGERVLGLSLVRRWIAGEGPQRWELDGESEAGWLEEEFWGSWLVRPLAYRDGLRLLELYGQALELRTLAPRDAQRAAAELVDEYSEQAPYIVSSLAATLPFKIFQEQTHHVARIRVARVGLALLELHARDDAWPRDLAAVVPLVGDETIVDPFTGDRLRYVPGERLQAARPERDWFEESDRIVWRFSAPRTSRR